MEATGDGRQFKTAAVRPDAWNTGVSQALQRILPASLDVKAVAVFPAGRYDRGRNRLATEKMQDHVQQACVPHAYIDLRDSIRLLKPGQPGMKEREQVIDAIISNGTGGDVFDEMTSGPVKADCQPTILVTVTLELNPASIVPDPPCRYKFNLRQIITAQTAPKLVGQQPGLPFSLAMFVQVLPVATATAAVPGTGWLAAGAT
ncbi:MAG: hypothetical protein Kow00100_09340 [Geothermobacteraceae bacterium]